MRFLNHIETIFEGKFNVSKAHELSVKKEIKLATASFEGWILFYIKKLIENSQLEINKKTVKTPATKIKTNDKIEICRKSKKGHKIVRIMVVPDIAYLAFPRVCRPRHLAQLLALT